MAIYADESNEYRLLDPTDHKIITRRDLVLEEDVPESGNSESIGADGDGDGDGDVLSIEIFR